MNYHRATSLLCLIDDCRGKLKLYKAKHVIIKKQPWAVERIYRCLKCNTVHSTMERYTNRTIAINYFRGYIGKSRVVLSKKRKALEV